MDILVTGSKGFIGKNLVVNLKNIRDGKNRTRDGLCIEKIYEYDIENTIEELNEACSQCDFVFNLAGVNRPVNQDEFKAVNYGFAEKLLNTLKKYRNSCPVMLSSSVQATLMGRFGVSEYGLSKKAGEEVFFEYGRETGAKTLIYRFPNIVGKWIVPNYNSAVGTFCYNIAHDLPIRIDDPSTELELLFAEDLIEEMLDALQGKEHHCRYNGVELIADKDGAFCYVPITHKASLGYIAECLRIFHDQPQTLLMPSIIPGSFEKKLYSMYLSYLPVEKMAVDLKTKCDERGSFTELFKTMEHGQFSVNISKPGKTKGQHWHNTKWEIFVVVSGHGLIQERRIGTDEVIEFEVCGNQLKAVYMLPGYTHNIINLSDTEDLVTFMWANECFDSKHPDTFAEEV